MSPIDTIAAFSNSQKSKKPIISAEEWTFIMEMSDLLPEKKPSIAQRFVAFSLMPARERPVAAIKALASIPRTGPVERGYSGDCIQSVHGHSYDMIYGLCRVFNNKSLCDNIFGRDANLDKLRKTGIRVIRKHDGTEGIITDLSPEETKKLPTGAKQKLEAISARVLYEEDSKSMKMHELYEEKATVIDQLVKVLDALESAVDSISVGMTQEHFDEFITTSQSIVKQYPTMALAFANTSITDLKTIYAEFKDDLQESYSNPKERRRAIWDLIIK